MAKLSPLFYIIMHNFSCFFLLLFSHLLLSFTRSSLRNNKLKFRYKFVDSPIHNLHNKYSVPTHNGLVIPCYKRLYYKIGLPLNSHIIFPVYKAKEFIINLFSFASFIARGKFRVMVLYRISVTYCSLQNLAGTAV